MTELPSPDGPPGGPWTVTLDGGTTNTRARLWQGNRPIAVARRAVGVRDAVVGERPARLAEAVRDCILEVCRQAGRPDPVRPDRIVAAGMLSSEVGLLAVPHVEAPAGLDELAMALRTSRLPDVAGIPIQFIPGVRTGPASGPDGWAEADVMRGEECETLGARLSLASQPAPSPDLPTGRPTAFVWPGSHTKLVEVDAAGRIVRSYTTLAGELMAALARHTLLAASLPAEWPEAVDGEAVAAGGRLARRAGLGRSAFLVRVADLTRAWSGPQRAAFWLGAVVADDVAHLARHPVVERAGTVWVGGRQPQRALYAAGLAAHLAGAGGRPAVRALDEPLADRASALGALAVARRREELGPGPLAEG